VLHAVGAHWWLAGGWALDAFLGRVTRPHDDTDVLILRPDHLKVREALSDWDAHAADPPGVLRPWLVGEPLPSTVHDIWLRRSPTDPWSFQLMIDQTRGDDWIFRLDDRITRPLADLSGPGSTTAVQVLAPEIQLLYKSKGLRSKDQADFDTVLPALDATRRDWLRSALAVVSPLHPWLDAL